MIRCNLAVILAEQNLKANKVSADTGISRTTLTALTSNSAQGVQFDTINTLCLYFKITLDKLFSFCPIDIRIIDSEVKTDSSGSEIYVMKFETYEHKRFYKGFLFGTLNEIAHNEKVYVFKIVSYAESEIYPPLLEFTSFLIDNLKKLPQVFKNDLENSIMEKVFPEYEEHNISIQWDLDELPF